MIVVKRSVFPCGLSFGNGNWMEKRGKAARRERENDWKIKRERKGLKKKGEVAGKERGRARNTTSRLPVANSCGTSHGCDHDLADDYSVL